MQSLLTGYPDWAVVLIALGVAAVLAFLVAEGAARAVRAVLRRALRGADVEALKQQWRRPVRIVRGLTFLVMLALFVLPALELMGRRTDVVLDPQRVFAWFLGPGVRIVLIAVLAWLSLKVVDAIVTRLEYEAQHGLGSEARERAKRIRTLGNLVEYVVAVVVTGVALLMILRELHLDITPVLTGAGIVGLAVGFGAQSIVKDFFSGFFLILENQVRVGDVAVVNGTGGLVEAITLRTITLRDVEGTVHIFPNGSINTLANRTKDYSYAVVDVSVAYSEDTDRVVQVLREVGRDLRTDAAVSVSVLDDLEVMGVENLGESSVVIKVRAKTLPQRQWDVARELRRRIKQRFDREGIEIPFRQMALSLRRPPRKESTGTEH